MHRSIRRIRVRRRPATNQVILAGAVVVALAASARAQRQFETLPRLAMPANSAETLTLATADVDGDGDLDVVAGKLGGQHNRLYLNDGYGGFTDETASYMPANNQLAFALDLGDVDGDGDVDIVLTGAAGIYLNDGTGAFANAPAGSLPTTSSFPRALELGDVDGDGDLDVVIGNFLAQNRVYLNDGTGSFTDETAGRMPVDTDETVALELGDVDGDGDLDIVCGNGSYSWGEQNRLYLNDGSGVFVDATAARLPVDVGETTDVALGDIDGDGDLDLVTAEYLFASPGQERIYLNDGSGTFTDATAARMPVTDDASWSVQLADVDNDGDLDLAVANYGQNRLYLNDGAGTFADATASRLPATLDQTRSLAVGDVDGDRDLDLVFGNPAPGIGLLQNLKEQLYAPAAPRTGLPYILYAYMRYGDQSVPNFALPYLSPAPASIPTPLGRLGIDPVLALAAPQMLVPQPVGVAAVGYTIPLSPGLVGQEIYSQAVLVTFPFELRLSSVVRDVIE